MKFVPAVLLILALIIESSVLSIPLVLLVLIVSTIFYKNDSMFIAAFIAGILLDILTFKTVGIASIFFSSVILFILLYQKKFEITTNYFVMFASLIGSFLFVIIYGYSNLILETIVSVIIGLLIFNMFKKLKIVKLEENG